MLPRFVQIFYTHLEDVFLWTGTICFLLLGNYLGRSSTQAVLVLSTLFELHFPLKELCHETAHARELRVNLKRLAQLFQVSRRDRHSEFIALNLGHPRIFFVFGGFLM